MSTTAICEIAPGSAARLPQLTIREVKTSAVEVPMTYPLGTSAATGRKAPLRLIDLETEEGGTGRTCRFWYRPRVRRGVDVVLRDAVAIVKGETAAPLAVAAGLPLATLLGAKPRPIPAYNSSGLGLMSPEAAADE